ncbi:cytochrome P450 [Cryptosporangium phraense]|uniref:Cytochrome P450 n=1 Tax=Cryptosporangium phraense TaxID=2593070 RepID=A0A545B0G7_9ACTN|nr:cytochrome P450 [Cryptosporangium phraense]TQS47072.1 cytochrome P450 [Cryptosporangium phraense]
MTAPDIPAGIDYTDPDTYADGVPLQDFAELRRVAPVWWNSTEYHAAGFDDDGFWVVTRHADIVDISRNPSVFSSTTNTAIVRFGPDMTRDAIDMQSLILLNMDPPKHTAQRSIVSRMFTPRAVNSLREELTKRARQIVDEAVEKGEGDFVSDVAVELPLQAIASLLGVPQEDRHKVFEWSNQMIGSDDDELATEASNLASANMLGYAMGMAEERRKCPADDLVTTLLNAQAGESGLSDDEFGFFVLILAVAGNETTRNAITHGMNAFLDHPDQWELYKKERPKTAPDEIVRWATPIIAFQRTAKQDTQLGGQDIKAGQRVVMFYSSANQDTEVFEHPEKFDILRSPNPHLGFGGSGTHYCIGANLARLEIDLIFNAIADAMPDITKAAEPARLRSGWINGIKHLPVRYA